MQLLPVGLSLWREQAEDSSILMTTLSTSMRDRGAVVNSGGDYDRWDLEIRGGLFGAARLLAGCEEHEGGRQCLRVRIWPRYSILAITIAAVLGASTVTSVLTAAWISASVFAAATVATVWRAVVDAGRAAGILKEHTRQLGQLITDHDLAR